jgi:hypothetical protein
MPDQHILRRAVQVAGEEMRPLLALESPQVTRQMMHAINNPVLNVGRVGTWRDQVQLYYIPALHHMAIGAGHIARLKRIELANGAHPAQSGDRIRFMGEASHADAAKHLGHSQDEDFMV